MIEILVKHPQLVFSAISVWTCSVLVYLLCFKIQRRGGLSFTGLILSVLLWQLGKLVKNTSLVFSMDWDIDLWTSLSFAGVTLIYATFFPLACRISFRDKGIYPWITGLAILSALFFIVMEFMGYISHGEVATQYGYFRDPKPLHYWYTASLLFFMIFAYFILNPFLYIKVAQIKRQITTIFFAALIGFSLGATEFFGIYGFPIYPVADLSPVIFCGMLYWAIYRYNMMGGGELVKTLLLRTLYFFTLLGLISFVYFFTRWIIHALALPSASFLFITISTLLLFILSPLILLTSKIIRQKLFPVRYSYRKLMTQLSDELSRLDTADKMIQTFITMMELEYGHTHGRAVLFAYHENAFDKSRFRVIGAPTKIRPDFFRERSFSGILSRRHIIDSLRLGTAQQKDRFATSMSLKPLERLNADLLMPLIAHHKLLGVITFRENNFRPESWNDASRLIKNLVNLLSNHYYQWLLLSQISEEQHLAKVGMMSAALAHEIKNPLEGIYGAAQILKENAVHNPKFVDMILKDAIRLNDVVKRFLDFSRPFSIQRSPVYIYSFLTQFVNKQNQVENHQPLILTGDSPLYAIVSDEAALTQILLNLTQNAIRYQPKDRPARIRLTDLKERLLISVEDEGPGIPENDRHKLFSPFFTTSIKGTGLGLATSRKIARALGGNLYYEPNQPGSNFTLQLPKILTTPGDKT